MHLLEAISEDWTVCFVKNIASDVNGVIGSNADNETVESGMVKFIYTEQCRWKCGARLQGRYRELYGQRQGVRRALICKAITGNDRRR